MLYLKHQQIYAMERALEVSASLEESILMCCAPVFDGLKPGAMFSASYTRKTREEIEIDYPKVPLLPEFREALEKITADLAATGISLRVLAWREHGALLYVYEPQAAQMALEEPTTARNLAILGYPSGFNAALDELVARLEAFDNAPKPSDFWDFPHEVGYFLGYPAPDVQAYVRNRGRNASVFGEWAAYGCAKRAAIMAQHFGRLQACTTAYESAYREGATLADLAALGQLTRELP